MSEDLTFMPTAVRGMFERLHKATEHAPEVNRLDNQRWRLTMRSDRVVMTYDIKVTRPGRSFGSTSTLSVDGVRRGLAKDFNDFVRIFRDPDSESGRAPGGEPAATTPIIACPVDEAPPEIQQFYGMLAGKVGDNAEVQVGRSGEGRWSIGYETDRVTFRMNFRNHKGRYSLAGTFQLVIDGVNRSAEVGDSLEKALALLGGKPGTPAPPPINAPARSTRQNSVEVRRSTVIRN